MLANVTRWFSLCAAPAAALVFLNDSSVPVSNSRSAWFGVATSGIKLFSFRKVSNGLNHIAGGPARRVARHAVRFSPDGLPVAPAQIRGGVQIDIPLRRHLLERPAGRGEDGNALVFVGALLGNGSLDAARDDVAVGWTDLAAVADAAEHGCRRHRCPAAHERIEHDVAGVREGLHEELDQRPRERSRMRTLAALGLHLDHVARPRQAAVPSVILRRT